MSNYTKLVNFAAKDVLLSGNPNKIILGTEINSELDAISTAIASKLNTDDGGLTGTTTIENLNITGDITSNVTLASTDAGATEEPTITLYRDSASAAASDVLGAIIFSGNDDGATEHPYAKINAVIESPTAAAEAGGLEFKTVTASAFRTAMVLNGDGDADFNYDVNVTGSLNSAEITTRANGAIQVGNLDALTDNQSATNQNLLIGNISAGNVTGTIRLASTTGNVAGGVLSSVRTGSDALTSLISAGPVYLGVLNTLATSYQISASLDHIWSISSSEVMRIDSSGNVGIDNASPAVPLEVGDSSAGVAAQAATLLSVGSVTEAAITIDGLSSGSIYFSGASNDAGFIKYNQLTDYMTFGTDSTERMRINASGNVGIGTNAPTSIDKLTLNMGDSTTGGIRLDTDNFTDQGASITWGRSAADGGGDFAEISSNRLGAGAAVNTGLVFKTTTNWSTTAPTESMRIDSAGNVGIGIASPKTTLNIAEANGSTLTIENTTTLLAENDSIGAIDFYANDNSGFGVGAKANIEAVVDNAFGNSVALSFGTINNSATTAVERMRIDGEGNVGIGETSPTGTLHVKNSTPLVVIQDSAGSAAELEFWNDSDSVIFNLRSSGNDCILDVEAGGEFIYRNAGSQQIRVDENGRAAYSGTNTGGNIIYIEPDRSAGGASAIWSNETNVNLQLGLFNGSNTAFLDLFAAGTGGVRFNVGGAERARFDSNGNMGIGDNNPASKISIIDSTETRYSIDIEDTATAPFGIRIDYTGAAPNGTSNAYFLGLDTDGEEFRIQSNGAFVQASDRRIKSNIVDSQSAGSVVDAIQVMEYDKGISNPEHWSHGFIAQDLYEVYPEAVRKPEEEDGMWGVSYSRLVPLLLKELQELRARVAELEAK